jgi:uncharacterized membrane protein YfcA
MVLVGLLVMGSVAGIFSALLGLGGGIFLVPALTILFHLPIRAAVGTSLVGIIATSAGVAAVAPPGRGGDVELALRLEVATTAGAILGSWLAGKISPQALSILFAIVVFCTAGYTLYKSRRKISQASTERLFHSDYHPKNWPGGLSVAGFAGTVAGLLGISGGFIKVPLMYAIMDVPLGVATATSSFMVGITAAASLFVYYGRGDIHPLVVIPTAVGVFIGAMLGVYLLPRLRAHWLRTALVGLLVIMGLQMLLQGLSA